jgi:nitrite reductase/ring-hydroxylating ferredoxin subunit
MRSSDDPDRPAAAPDLRSGHARGLSRRQFCVVATAGVAGACTAGDARISVGGLHDVSTGAAHDGGASAGDLAGNGDAAVTCGVSSLNAGAASAFVSGDAKLLTDPAGDQLYLCRDAGGLFAMTALCPHTGCTVGKLSTGYLCPCHGSTFDLNGQNPTGPAAPSGLTHFAVCVDAGGNVLVDVATRVDPNERA